MKPVIAALALAVLALPAGADVELQIRDLTGAVNTISSDGSTVRIDSGRQGYVLIDPGAGKFYMVDLARGQIMQSSLGKGGVAVTGAGGVKIGFRSDGGGEKIAGYPTRRFTFSANGQDCGTIHASSKLLDNTGIRSMFEAMRTMQHRSRRMMGGLGGLMSPCQQAGLQLTEVIDTIGAPMKMQDDQGQLISEVLAVDTDRKLPTGYYRVPDNLAVVDIDAHLSGAKQQAQEVMQNLPDMNPLIQQMQGGGAGMSEEMQQQMQQRMEQMQQMLQQLQQQQQ